MPASEAKSVNKPAQRGSSVTYAPGKAPEGHEAMTRLKLAQDLAQLLGLDYGGEHDPSVRYREPLYFVPADSIVGLETAAALGIRSERDLFGGVVPHAFVATKSITHPLIGPQARAPEGWTPDFASRVREAVLAGFTAFSRADASACGAALLARGPVRVKRSLGIGGRGQFLCSDAAELEKAIDEVDDDEIASHGIVVEEHLADVVTLSVGQVRVGGTVASYWGTQRLTASNHGAEVYGGSELMVVRGDFDALATLGVEPSVEQAIAQARVYDAAAACFDGFFASRRNYDIAQGRDARGNPRSGVLEQSWRSGGASGAEVEALKRFAADPSLRAIRAASFEVYGGQAQVPPDATVYFDDVDPNVGALTKYVTIHPYDNAR